MLVLWSHRVYGSIVNCGSMVTAPLVHMYTDTLFPSESMRVLSHSFDLEVSFFDTEELGTPGSKLTRTISYPEHNVRTGRLLI